MIFVDTGALFALADARDPAHDPAVACLRSLPSTEPLGTTLFVLGEAWHLLKNRAGFQAAVGWWERILTTAYEILPVEQSDLAEALKIQKKYRDQDFGLVDCTTFALCEKHRISKVFTFDRKHFSLFRPSFTPRFDLLP